MKAACSHVAAVTVTVTVTVIYCQGACVCCFPLVVVTVVGSCLVVPSLSCWPYSPCGFDVPYLPCVTLTSYKCVCSWDGCVTRVYLVNLSGVQLIKLVTDSYTITSERTVAMVTVDYLLSSSVLPGKTHSAGNIGKEQTGTTASAEQDAATAAAAAAAAAAATTTTATSSATTPAVLGATAS